MWTPMKENKKGKIADVESETHRIRIPCPEGTEVPCLPKLITLDLCTVRRAINRVAGKLCDDDYEKKLTQYTQASVNDSLETLHQLAQLSCRLSCLNRREWDCLINCSIDELMEANLDFNRTLMKSLIEQSTKTIGILEKNLDNCQKDEKEQPEVKIAIK